jgi:hypothetical protein
VQKTARELYSKNIYNYIYIYNKYIEIEISRNRDRDTGKLDVTALMKIHGRGRPNMCTCGGSI